MWRKPRTVRSSAAGIAGVALLLLAVGGGCAGGGGGGGGSSGSATGDTTPPTFAGATSATAKSGTSVLIGWSPASDDVTAQASIVYRIHRGTAHNGENFTTPVATTAAGATSFTDTGLSPGVTYYYVVRAKDQAGNIDSNAAEVTAATPAAGDVTPPTFAGATTLTIPTTTSMTVFWSAASDTVTAQASIVYRVYRGTAAGGDNFITPLATTAAGATSYVDSSATTPPYYYVVRAVDLVGNEDANTAEVFGPVSFATDVYAGLNLSGKCSGCHTGPEGVGTLPAAQDLTTAANAYAALVDVTSLKCTSLKRVDSALGSSSSFLVDKLTGSGICSGGGARMPFGGPYLNATQINTVRAWIDQGVAP
jgi:hypothetical protein